METAPTASLNSCVVNEQQTIDPQLFVELVREPLQRRDTNALARLIQDRWSHGQIVRLLESPDADARKLAALALGFVGDRRSITSLASCLKDSDPMVNQMAEHALWTVWFRSGSQEAQERVQRGSELLSGALYAEALQEFAAAMQIDPTYAEARNQRCLTFYFMEDFAAAIEEGETVVQLMPSHFGAWSGLGHCHAHMGDTRRALTCYRRALDINPYLHCIRQIVMELTSGQCTASSRFDHLAG